MICLILLLSLTDRTDVEVKNKIHDLLSPYHASPAKIPALRALANHQVEALAMKEEVNEFDLQGRSFAVRCQQVGFNTSKLRLDEFYYIFYDQTFLNDFQLWELILAFRFENFTHYAIAVKRIDKKYFMVITIIQLPVLAARPRKDLKFENCS